MVDETMIIVYDNEPFASVGQIRGMYINNNPATFATVVSSGETMIKDINSLLFKHSAIIVYNKLETIPTILKHPDIKCIYYSKNNDICSPLKNILQIPSMDESGNLSAMTLVNLFKKRLDPYNCMNKYMMRRKSNDQKDKH